MGKLVLYMPDGTLHDIALDKERLTIGRHSDNDVCLPFPAVSGEHAAVVNILTDSFLEDLGSTNGTLVNGKRVVKHFLRDHDLIDIGRNRLLYLSDENVRADPLPPEVRREAFGGLVEQVVRARDRRSDNRRTDARPRHLVEESPAEDDDLLAEIEAATGSEREPAKREPVVRESAVGNAARHQAMNRAAHDDQPAETEEDFDSRAGGVPAVARRRGSSDWLDWPSQDPVGNGDFALPQGRNQRPIMVEARTSDARLGAMSKSKARTYWVCVLSGPNAGRELQVTGDAFSVGRVGTQVVRISRADGVWYLAPLDGPQPALLNGTPVPPQGMAIAVGDRLELGGNELTLEQR
jgi:hypothetical protein